MACDKKTTIPSGFGYMSVGEKMIWAAAYQAEFHRWTKDTPLEPYKAAKHAIAYASEAVLAARMAVSNSGLEDAVDQGLLLSVIASGEADLHELPKLPSNQFLVPLDNTEVARLVEGAGSHSQLVRESANAQLKKIAGLLGVEVE